MDIVYIACIALFVAMMAGVAFGCARLGGGK